MPDKPTKLRPQALPGPGRLIPLKAATIAAGLLILTALVLGCIAGWFLEASQATQTRNMTIYPPTK
jgi:hypothetical protein